jgi:hypothetical protein
MGTLAKLWSGLTRVEIIGALIGVAATILAALTPAFLKAFSSGDAIRIHRIEDPDDPYLSQALDVYTRIPENERDSEEDVVRWIAE